MTKIVACSDLHGNLNFTIPSCDILCIAGDITEAYNTTKATNCALQAKWLEKEFKPWLEQQPAKHIMCIFGNHDWIGQLRPELIPMLPANILTDGWLTIEGLKIYGTPWSLPFYDWAFMAYEDELEEKYKLIPQDTDILISHGPAYGVLDIALDYNGLTGDKYNKIHTGSTSLLKKIKEIKPKLVLTGHIHDSYGVSQINDTIVANVSLLNDQYEMVNKPFEWVI